MVMLYGPKNTKPGNFIGINGVPSWKRVSSSLNITILCTGALLGQIRLSLLGSDLAEHVMFGMFTW